MSRSEYANYDQSEGSRYPHRWGYQDTQFEFDGPRSVRLSGSRYPLSGYSLPEFIPFVEEMLDVPVRPEDLIPQITKPEIPPSRLADSSIRALSSTFDPDQISLDDGERLVHSHGQLSVDEIYKILFGESIERAVDLIFYPRSEEEVVKLADLARSLDLCLIPYGGGTNVSGALAIPPEENRAVVSVDMREMRKILWIDEENNQACIEAGISGKQLEAELTERGFTSGHDPDSVELSTLGGWIATNASGMKKNRYGNIEEIVLEASLVTAMGLVETRRITPRHASGIQPGSMLFGSEGNLGIITKAVIKIHPKPEEQNYGSLVFPTFERGVRFLRALRATGVLPASIRLVNNSEFRFGQALKGRPGFFEKLKSRMQKFLLLKILGFEPNKIAACTIVMEGNPAEVRQQGRTIFPLAKRFGGVSGGRRAVEGATC